MQAHTEIVLVIDRAYQAIETRAMAASCLRMMGHTVTGIIRHMQQVCPGAFAFINSDAQAQNAGHPRQTLINNHFSGIVRPKQLLLLLLG